jgi:hypothetical protein
MARKVQPTTDKNSRHATLRITLREYLSTVTLLQKTRPGPAKPRE